jgi:hypothetical protein
VTFKPICPGLPNRRRENELIPKVQKHVNIDEVADVLFGAFSKHLFVHPGSVCSISQVICESRTAPVDVKWQFDPAGCLLEIRILDVTRYGHWS